MPSYEFGFGNQPFIDAKCPVTDCFTTDQVSLLGLSFKRNFKIREKQLFQGLHKILIFMKKINIHENLYLCQNIVAELHLKKSFKAKHLFRGLIVYNNNYYSLDHRSTIIESADNCNQFPFILNRIG